MSGPLLGEAICYYDADQMATYETVRQLRELADYVEDPYGNWSDVDNENIAELLRLKADKIESSLRMIEKGTQTDSFKDLVKAIQWTQSGDYGRDAIQRAWEDYDE